jgi:hypothetical protein
MSAAAVLSSWIRKSGALYEALAPFRPMVDFDVEPVVNVIEALAISLDVEEWVASVKVGSRA